MTEDARSPKKTDGVPPPIPLQPLEHGPPPTPHDRGAIVVRMIVGAVVYVGLTWGWSAYSGHARLAPATFWTVWIAMTVGLFGLALYLNVRHGKEGYGYGMLMAFVVAFLLVIGAVLLILGLGIGRKLGSAGASPFHAGARVIWNAYKGGFADGAESA